MPNNVGDLIGGIHNNGTIGVINQSINSTKTLSYDNTILSIIINGFGLYGLFILHS